MGVTTGADGAGAAGVTGVTGSTCLSGVIGLAGVARAAGVEDVAGVKGVLSGMVGAESAPGVAGVTGAPGVTGALRSTDGASTTFGRGFSGPRRCCNCAGGSARPPLARIASIWRSNDGGAGGGSWRATTGRLAMAIGGRLTGVWAAGPSTLWRAGRIPGGRGVALAPYHCGGGAMIRPVIDWPDAKLLCETTVSARGALRLA